MSVPKKKTPKKATKSRRADESLEETTTTECENCGADILQHHACDECGFYKGEKII
jgi:large subunit ribosomal protein L32